MNMKQKIGQRIMASRKELGITLKELAARTHQKLSPARISNWEQGTRSPGPTEVKIIADILGVAPSYLLCLTNDPKGDIQALSNYISLLPLSEIKPIKNNPSQTENNSFTSETQKIFLEDRVKSIVSANTFATIIEDSSMQPDFRPDDIVIADPNRTPVPGQYVIAYIKATNEIIIRKYRELNKKSLGYALVALNQDWGIISINSPKEGTIIATLVEHRRLL